MAASSRRRPTRARARSRTVRVADSTAKPSSADRVDGRDGAGRVDRVGPGATPLSAQDRELDGIGRRAIEPVEPGCRLLADPAPRTERQQADLQPLGPRRRRTGHRVHAGRPAHHDTALGQVLDPRPPDVERPELIEGEGPVLCRRQGREGIGRESTHARHGCRHHPGTEPEPAFVAIGPGSDPRTATKAVRPGRAPRCRTAARRRGRRGCWRLGGSRGPRPRT